MASLVAYGSSDESENEDENDSANEKDDYPSAISKSTSLEESTIDNDVPETSENKKDNKSSLFSSLPLPKTKTPGISLYTEDNFLEKHKIFQKKEPVKITIPSLSEFKEEEEEEEPVKKKLKPSTKGSGLFAVLPPPKNFTVKEIKRLLVPNILTKTPPKTPPVQKTVKLQPAPSVLINYADSEDESDGEGDFFSLKNDTCSTTFNHEEPDMYNGFSANDNSSKIEASEESETDDQPLTFNSKFNPSPWASGTTQVSHTCWQNDDEPSTSQPEASYISVQQDDLQLNEEALQQLCGRRAKRQQQEMQLIDVSGDAIMPDPKEWLTKQISQEQATKIHSHSHRKSEGPTTQQRRKHQITYLAFQAKENELELKNQWSQNRMSRKQTQSKYGF